MGDFCANFQLDINFVQVLVEFELILLEFELPYTLNGQTLFKNEVLILFPFRKFALCRERVNSLLLYLDYRK